MILNIGAWCSASMLSGELPGGCHHYAKNCPEGKFSRRNTSARLYSMKVDAIRSRKHSFEGVELINSGDTRDDEAT
jgi:hypothetical protein